MELYEMPKIVKNRKRIGRGNASGWGRTSGKGEKGQKARSGGSKPQYFEGGQTPLIRRLPKRGFKNIFRVEYDVVNVGLLNSLCSDGDRVDLKFLMDKNVVKGSKPVKILGDGELNKKVSVSVDAFSKSAKEKIEKAGGSIEVG